jgi:phospholipase C
VINRRQAIKRIGGLAGAASLSKLLTACGDDSSDPDVQPTMVFMMMENRTYDHVFGARKLQGLPGNGLTAGITLPNVNGDPVALYEPPLEVAALCGTDPPHSWNPSRMQWNNGANDGFLRVHQMAHDNNTALTEVVQYLTRTHQPISWALADAYTTCDRWHASVLGPTLPNRAYWHVATSLGLDNNTDVLNAFFMGVPVPSIYNRLEDKGIDWAYYYASLPVVSLLGNDGPYKVDLGPNDGTGHIRQFTKYSDDLFDPNGGFFKDAAAGKLPPVVYIDPFFFLNDDHPPAHPLRGQELIAAVYTALANSPQWKKCTLVIAYDEHGGFYDHVSPGTTTDDSEAVYGKPGFDQLGFRVPAMVIGPYAKQGYVSSVQYDHTSALKHIASAFDLEPLNPRMAAANDLLDCIDMERLARGDAADPITLPSIDFQFTSTDETTGEIIVDGVSHEWTRACVSEIGSFRALDPISTWADEHPEAFGALDLRRDHKRYLRSISDYLRANRTVNSR